MSTPTTAPIITCSRLRMQTDGQGITTLVCFHGCPLRCKWCINPFSFTPDTKRTDLSPGELYHKVKVDELYFLATGGGVTFGGGEPLLYASYLKEFRAICGEDWHLCAETSLNVPENLVRIAASCIDQFYIDCKDTNPDIYLRYTGKDNTQMLSNLKLLLSLVGPERIVARIPLIPQFNTDAHRHASRILLEGMGLTRFNFFTYLVKNAPESS